METKKQNYLKYLNFTNITHFGIPTNISSAMAFHSVQGIIGLGTKNGKIKL